MVLQTAIKTWEIRDIVDFIIKFKLEKEIKKRFKIKDIKDIYEHQPVDEELIYDYLEKDKRLFSIQFVDDKYDGYWIIDEIDTDDRDMLSYIKKHYEEVYDEAESDVFNNNIDNMCDICGETATHTSRCKDGTSLLRCNFCFKKKIVE